MARTGLRMMPTSPSPPLKFRTVGFTQYGSKTSMSDSAFLNRNSVKPAPGVPSIPLSLPPSFAHFHVRYTTGTAVQINPRFYELLFERPTPLYPRGPWLQSELCCLDPASLTVTPSASPAGTLRFRITLYSTPSLCGSASASHGTFPTFTAALSMHVADPTPAVHRVLPLYSLGDSRLPLPTKKSPPAMPSLPAIIDGMSISELHRSLYAATCTFALPS
jgi:hypothetical protein